MTRSHLIVPAAEANRRFSKLLRAAREGARITITSHGEPVAELGPAPTDAARLEAEALRRAMADLETHWATLAPRVVGSWGRAELYERD